MKTREQQRVAWQTWYRSKGKTQNTERMRRWREQNPERWRAIARKASLKSIRKRRLGMRSEEQYQRLLRSQNNCCAICETPFTKTPCLDHDHASGKSRGLLCNPCNQGIGFLRDDTKLLRKAALYLEAFLPAKVA